MQKLAGAIPSALLLKGKRQSAADVPSVSPIQQQDIGRQIFA